MKVYKFIRTGQEWYIDLPEYLEQGGSIGDLQMVDGADKMLDLMAENESTVTLFISKEQFEGADGLSAPEMSRARAPGPGQAIRDGESSAGTQHRLRTDGIEADRLSAKSITGSR